MRVSGTSKLRKTTMRKSAALKSEQLPAGSKPALDTHLKRDWPGTDGQWAMEHERGL